jgi:hypothetical protein
MINKTWRLATCLHMGMQARGVSFVKMLAALCSAATECYDPSNQHAVASR